MLRKATSLLALLVTAQLTLAVGFEKADKIAAKIPSGSTKTVPVLADYIKANLDNPEDQLRATYVWIAKNISFDKGAEMDLTASYSTDSAANVVLKRRKAVSSDYAELFQKLAIHLGYEAYTITGYTKRNNVVDEDGHAWNAIRMNDGKWLMFDVMWGAGILSQGKFSKKPSTDFCMVTPENMLKTHMPFDPMWQLMEHPINAEAFIKDDFTIHPGKPFNYNDTIKVENKLFRSEQLEHLCRRLQWAGNVNNSTSTMLDVCAHNIVVLKARERYAMEYRKITQFNSIVDRVNKVISNYNQYSQLKKSYKSKRIPVSQLKTMIDSCSSNIIIAEKGLSALSFERDEQITQKNNLIKTLYDLRKEVDLQGVFLKQQKDTKKGKTKKS